MIYLYRREASQSAREVVNVLGGDLGMAARRARRFPHPIARRNPRPGDVVVAWGEAYQPPQAGIRVLNGRPIRNKFEDAQVLAAAGIPTIEVSRTRPVQAAPPPPPDLITPAQARLDEAKTALIRAVNMDQFDNVAGIVAHWGTARAGLHAARTAPPPVAPRQPHVDWVGRMNAHIGGNDLLTPPQRPDFYVKKENLVREYRVHSFRGQSIRAGIKVHRDDFPNPHPWVRSWDGGWRISYTDGAVRQAHRDLAHRAVQSLGLDFGAVDIGEKADGTLMILEVNRAPGAEGGTPLKYAEAIQRYLRGGDQT